MAKTQKQRGREAAEGVWLLANPIQALLIICGIVLTSICIANEGANVQMENAALGLTICFLIIAMYQFGFQAYGDKGTRKKLTLVNLALLGLLVLQICVLAIRSTAFVWEVMIVDLIIYIVAIVWYGYVFKEMAGMARSGLGF